MGGLRGDPARSGPVLPAGAEAAGVDGRSAAELRLTADGLQPEIAGWMRFAEGTLTGLQARTHLRAFGGLRRRLLERRVKQLARPESRGEFIQVPRIDARRLPARTFRELLRSEATPIVLAGFAKDSPAVREWTPEFLAERYGDVEMRYASDSPECIKISAVVEGMRTGDDTKWVAGFNDLMVRHRELRASLPLEEIERYSGESRTSGTELFMGGRLTPYHCANFFNFFIMVHGVKKWTFVHPKHSVYMLASANRDLLYVRSLLPVENEPPVPKLVTELQPGDVLLNPPWWWHKVENLTQATIAVATRWAPLRQRFRSANSFYSWMQWMAPHQWKMLFLYQLPRRDLTDKEVRWRFHRV